MTSSENPLPECQLGCIRRFSERIVRSLNCIYRRYRRLGRRSVRLGEVFRQYTAGQRHGLPGNPAPVPGFKNLMDDLPARHTTMAINRVISGTVLKPDSIYLIPQLFAV